MSAKARAEELAGAGFVLLGLGLGDQTQGHQALQKTPLLAKPSCWPLGFESYFTMAQGMELKCPMYAKVSALSLNPVPSSKCLTLMLILILR